MRRALLCSLVSIIPSFAACQSALSQDTKRIRDAYDVELADLTAKYRRDMLECDSAPDPALCKQQLGEAYRERIDLLWALENAEYDQAMQNAIRGLHPNASN